MAKDKKAKENNTDNSVVVGKPKKRKVRKDTGTKRVMPMWTPTVGQKKLLTEFMKPENRHCTIKELCKRAGISRTVYYKGFDNPYFVKEYKRLSLQLITESVAPLIQSAVREAKLGSFNHTKLLLEMENLHQDSLAVTDKKTTSITAEMTPKQAAELYAEKVKGKK